MATMQNRNRSTDKVWDQSDFHGRKQIYRCDINAQESLLHCEKLKLSGMCKIDEHGIGCFQIEALEIQYINESSQIKEQDTKKEKK